MTAMDYEPKRWRRIVLRTLGVLLLAYALFGAYVWWAMRQPPETFGRVMSHMPEPAVFMVFPFETLWMRARAGTLHVGDPAPDFSLVKLDKTDHIQLSSFAAEHRPVVLIFGSYT
jgi:hypothetical protein